MTTSQIVVPVCRRHVGDQARFRYQVRGGDLAIGIKLVEPDRVLEQAFNAVVEQVQEGLPEGVTVRNGRS